MTVIKRGRTNLHGLPTKPPGSSRSRRRKIMHIDPKIVDIADIYAPQINSMSARVKIKPRLNKGLPGKRQSAPDLLDVKRRRFKQKDAGNTVGPW